MRRAAKVDANQREIVAALRQVGCEILDLSAVGQGCPDILCARHGINFLLECKRPKAKGEAAGKPTKAQLDFFARWQGRGQYAIVHTVDEALRAVGAVSP